jgi:predicted metal-dependent hydrolase
VSDSVGRVGTVDALWDGSIDGWREDAAPGQRRHLVHPTPDLEPEPVPHPEPQCSPITGMEVQVVRSAKRRKSVSARVVEGRIVVRMPQWMSKAQEAEYVTSLVAKLERQHTAKEVDLASRAAQLGARYGLPQPSSIRWVANQRHRWGSCTPSTGDIRISDRIAAFPSWVLDAVIVHELAHLVHLHHTPAFWSLVQRYPKTERAYGFLIAKQLADDEVDLR